MLVVASDFELSAAAASAVLSKRFRFGADGLIKLTMVTATITTDKGRPKKLAP